MPPAPPWYTARASEIWAGDMCEAWRAGIGTEEEATEVVQEGAGLRMNVAVGVVHLALLREVTAEKVETGMLTSVPGCPLVIDKGTWMRSGGPWEAVFNSRWVPVGLWVVMPVPRDEATLEAEVISWRMGACCTMAVVVAIEAGVG